MRGRARAWSRPPQRAARAQSAPRWPAAPQDSTRERSPQGRKRGRSNWGRAAQEPLGTGLCQGTPCKATRTAPSPPPSQHQGRTHHGGNKLRLRRAVGRCRLEDLAGALAHDRQPHGGPPGGAPALREGSMRWRWAMQGRTSAGTCSSHPANWPCEPLLATSAPAAPNLLAPPNLLPTHLHTPTPSRPPHLEEHAGGLRRRDAHPVKLGVPLRQHLRARGQAQLVGRWGWGGAMAAVARRAPLCPTCGRRSRSGPAAVSTMGSSRQLMPRFSRACVAGRHMKEKAVHFELGPA